MKKLGLILWVVAILPILLFVYNPSMELGAFGLLLGMMGMTISPLLLIIMMVLFVKSRWK